LEAIFIALFIVGMIAAVLGILGLFKPLVNLRMANRRWAGAWIFSGFVVMMATAVNAPPSPTTNQPRGQVTVTERPKSAAFANAEAAYLALSQCEVEPNADCSQEAAAAEVAGAAWDRRVDEISTEVDGRADCIRRELGDRFNESSISDTLEARSKCGIEDPSDAEVQLREQRERRFR
jgi:hypothetical protein